MTDEEADEMMDRLEKVSARHLNELIKIVVDEGFPPQTVLASLGQMLALYRYRMLSALGERHGEMFEGHYAGLLLALLKNIDCVDLTMVRHGDKKEAN